MLGVTDFLVKGQLDAALLERSIRYAVRHHETLAELRAEPGALRARGAGRQRRHLGLGPGHRRASTLAALEGDARLRRRRHRRHGPRSGSAACIPTTSGGCARPSTPTSTGETPALRERAPHAPPRRRATAGCSAAALASATRTGRATRMAGSMTDITDRKAAEEQLLHDALHDALTGLPNRALFLDRLERSLAAPSASPTTAAPSCSSTSTASSSSTTASATRSATSCWSRWRGRLSRTCGRATRSPASAATSSPSCSTTSRSAGRAAAGRRAHPGHRSPAVPRRRPRAVRQREHRDRRQPSRGSRAGRADARRRHRDVRRQARGRRPVVGVRRAHAQPRRRASFSSRRELRRGDRARTACESSTSRSSTSGRGELSGFEALARWPDAGEQVSPVEFIPVAEETGLIGALGAGARRGVRAARDWRARGLVATRVDERQRVGRPAQRARPGRATCAAALSDDAACRASGCGSRSPRARSCTTRRMRAALAELAELGVSAADRRLRHRLLVAHLPPATSRSTR